jgi:hypothetical protein
VVQFRRGGLDLEKLTYDPDLNTGRALKFKKEPHNRVRMSIAKGFSHPMKTFGNPGLCEGGQLSLG